ncbi:M67 family metallopeptidase [Candidatus Saganbacteria bacterium]|nr:M67 family metallopeptidase [Candidatus Saganbacteria bacterium]
MLLMNIDIKNEIIQHAREAQPREACGILAGKNGAVEKLYRMKNVSDRPEDCYFMDSLEQLKVVKEIRKLGQKMLGIYHSHPRSAAYPSARDVELAYYEDAAYLIVSQNEIRAFRIVEGKISEEEVKWI